MIKLICFKRGVVCPCGNMHFDIIEDVLCVFCGKPTKRHFIKLLLLKILYTFSNLTVPVILAEGEHQIDVVQPKAVYVDLYGRVFSCSTSL